jgi:hypothetical protein
VIKSYQTAQLLAQELLARAEENEPEVSAEMVGLENKFKTEESLIRKLLMLFEKDKTPKPFVQKLKKFARHNNDALRYTFIFSDDDYQKGFMTSLSELQKKGFEIPPNRIWDAWELEGNIKDTGYRGINITIIYSQKQKFELQFHTAESFRLKTETHHLYEELRDLRTSNERRKEIIKVMVRLAKQINRPQGI